jgi:hypothetical protein
VGDEREKRRNPPQTPRDIDRGFSGWPANRTTDETDAELSGAQIAAWGCRNDAYEFTIYGEGTNSRYFHPPTICIVIPWSEPQKANQSQSQLF